MLLIPEHYSWTLANCLRAAADQYTTDAAASDAANLPHAAEQFRQQAKQAKELAGQIETGYFSDEEVDS